jgi:hypothetical protein
VPCGYHAEALLSRPGCHSEMTTARASTASLAFDNLLIRQTFQTARIWNLDAAGSRGRYIALRDLCLQSVTIQGYDTTQRYTIESVRLPIVSTGICSSAHDTPQGRQMR